MKYLQNETINEYAVEKINQVNFYKKLSIYKDHFTSTKLVLKIINNFSYELSTFSMSLRVMLLKNIVIYRYNICGVGVGLTGGDVNDLMLITISN